MPQVTTRTGRRLIDEARELRLDPLQRVRRRSSTHLGAGVGDAGVSVPTGGARSAGGPGAYGELPESLFSQAARARHPNATSAISLLIHASKLEGPSGRDDGWASVARQGHLGQGLHAPSVIMPLEALKLPRVGDQSCQPSSARKKACAHGNRVSGA